MSETTFFKQCKPSKVLHFIQNKLVPYQTIIGEIRLSKLKPGAVYALKNRVIMQEVHKRILLV